MIDKIESREGGFTLIEILVALFLITLVVGLTAGNIFSSRNHLENNLFELERTLRYARDESTLRNAIVRLRINLESPQTHVLEYGPSENFVLPPETVEAGPAVRSRAEQEFLEDQQKRLDDQFHRVRAYQERDKQFDVTVLGVGTLLRDQFMTEGEVSIYVYPTGEMDAGIIILGSDDEIGMISFEAFLDEYVIEYRDLNTFFLRGDLNEQQFEAAQRIFDEWQSSR